MSYFSYLPNTYYKIGKETFLVKDILTRSTFITEYRPVTNLYNEYIMKDSDSLQSIAHEYYGSPEYHWVIAIFNEIHDMNFEVPMDLLTLDHYIDAKYGADRLATRHYVNVKTGLIIGEVKEYYPGYSIPAPEIPSQEITPVTFENFETQLNEDKRIIKLMRVELLPDFVEQFSRSFR